MPNKDPSGRYWFGTLWRFKTTPKDDPDFWLTFGTQLVYGVCQLEQGKDSEDPHIQIYLEFKNVVKFSTLQNWTGTDNHWELRKAKKGENPRDYCMKKETRIDGPWEFGQWTEKEQGKRNDLLKASKSILKGKKTMKEIGEKYPVEFVKFHRGFKELKALQLPKRTMETEWELHLGKTRKGKTRYIQTMYPDAYWKDQDKWWDGYEGQDVTVLDEFSGWIQFGIMLRLADSTPLQVETKGGKVHFSSRKLIIISNLPPWLWYKKTWDEDNSTLRRDAFLERCNRSCIHLDIGVEPIWFDHWTKLEDYWISNMQ